ncbi:MAG: hypothetical protein WCP96_00535 [Methylococcaceae bacterium]
MIKYDVPKKQHSIDAKQTVTQAQEWKGVLIGLPGYIWWDDYFYLLSRISFWRYDFET